MINIQTVFICILHTTVFYAAAYLVFFFSQKTHRGFGRWTLGAIANAGLYGAAILRLLPGEWIGAISVAGVALCLPISAILRTDAILRFTKNGGLPRYVYFIPLTIIPLNIYLYLVQNMAMRYLILLAIVLPFNYMSFRTLFLFQPKTGRVLYICGGIFFLMRAVGLAFEAALLFIHKQYVSIFHSPDMGAYLLFTLVAEVGIGLLFFLVSAQRSQEELLDAKACLERATPRGSEPEQGLSQ